VIPDILSLRSGAFALELCPALGGSIAALRWAHPGGETIDLLRPTAPASIAKGDIETTACFPLTPFSNRVRSGRFIFEGSEIVLPANTSEPHAQHGHGWQRPWDVAMAARDNAVLRLTHAAGDWPFDYVMEQRLQLSAGALRIELMARNDSNLAMPYGLGLHPYFPRTPKCRLTAAVSGFWETDEEVMPTRHTPPPVSLDPAKGLPVAERIMDNAFTGWQGEAVIDWPEHRTRLARFGPARRAGRLYPAGRKLLLCRTGEQHDGCLQPSA